MTDQQPPVPQPPASRRAAREAAAAGSAPSGDARAAAPSATGAPDAPLRRPRGRDRYAGLDVVLDAPSSVRAPTSEPEPGRRRLVLSPHETEAVRPPAQLPRVAPTPVPRASGRRLIASGRYERPLSDPAAPGRDEAPDRDEAPGRDEAPEAPAGPGAPVASVDAPSRQPVEPPVVTRSLTIEHAARRAPRRQGRRAATPTTPATLVLGVLNVTPDSFSDGGRHDDLEAALAHGRALVAAGAAVVDVGGESTRPGATRVDPEEERRRVLPVVRELVAEGVRVSIDTVHASTAAAALELGADIVNDVSGGLADPDMPRVAAESGRTFVAMHWRGFLDAGSSRAHYDDVVRDVRDELSRRVDDLVAAGVDRARLVLDPGLGFSKVGAQNWQLLAGLPEILGLGLPVLVGASRKRFLAELLPEGAPPEARDPATAVLSVLAAQVGAWGVRVHDVAGTRAALDVLQAWQSGARTTSPRRARHA